VWIDGKLEHTVYAGWAAEVAQSQRALFVDLNQLVAAKYDRIGQDKLARDYFRIDHTHTSPLGARLNAESVVEGLRLLKNFSLTNYLLTKLVVKSPGPSMQAIKLWPTG